MRGGEMLKTTLEITAADTATYSSTLKGYEAFLTLSRALMTEPEPAIEYDAKCTQMKRAMG